MLTAQAIRERVASGEIIVDPYDKDRVQPNSVDVTLGKGVATFREFTYEGWYGPHMRPDSSFERSQTLKASGQGRDDLWLDPKEKNPVRAYEMDESGWLVKPGILYLMHINEHAFAPKLVMTIAGKSSLARLGLIVHFTAAHGETGFEGQFTLEVSAINHPIRLYPDMAIGQILFQTIEGPPEDYKERGNYVGVAAKGAVPSRSWKQF